MNRRQIFAKNLKEIEAHNYLYSKGLKTFTMGVNKYSDLVGKINESIIQITTIMVISAVRICEFLM